MSKTEDYILKLKTLYNWDDYLRTNSNLPSPRGNLELICAVAATGREDFINRLIAADNPASKGNSPEDFLTMCAVVGLGRLVAEGNTGYFEKLQHFASDRRWRLRESVAMALQLVGDRDIDMLLVEMEKWSLENEFEKRAAVAALCEPRLLKVDTDARRVLDLLDSITASIIEITNRKSEGFGALKKGLGYGWSVAVAACPDKGKALMEKWLTSPDGDIRWIMKENLGKNRLMKLNADWTACQRAKLVLTK